jgi:hypothetical protein
MSKHICYLFIFIKNKIIKKIVFIIRKSIQKMKTKFNSLSYLNVVIYFIETSKIELIMNYGYHFPKFYYFFPKS